MRKLSCGIVLLSDRAEIFLGHATGSSRWDIPKGGIEPDETPLDAALRETREEAGLDLSSYKLQDLGRLKYRPEKDLHLFMLRLPRSAVDPSTCVCTSSFRTMTGKLVLEMDRFAWVPLEQVAKHCASAMCSVLANVLPAQGR